MNETTYSRIVSMMTHYPADRRREAARHHDAILADWLAGYPVSTDTVDASTLALAALIEADSLTA